MQGQFSEQWAVLAQAGPKDIAESNKTSPWVNVENFQRVGVIGASGSAGAAVTVSLLKGNDSGDGGTTALVRSASIASAGTGATGIINANFEADLDPDNKYMAVKISAATGQTNVAAAFLLGGTPRYAPASDNDGSNVSVIKDA